MIQKIELVNFLKHKHFLCDITNRFVLIKGVNSSGKTSILDAISLLSKEYSISGHSLPLINNNETFANVIFYYNGAKFIIKINERGKRQYIANEKSILYSQFCENFSTISYGASDQYLFLTKQGKRDVFERFLNNISNYQEFKNSYHSLATKRLKILEQQSLNSKLLDVIENEMANIGFKIQKIRYANKFDQFEDYEFIFFDKNFIEHATDEQLIENIKKNLFDNRKIDPIIKKNKFNVLSFDFDIKYNSNEFKIISNSEQKRAMLTLITKKIVSEIYAISGKKSIILIDEFDAFISEENLNHQLNAINENAYLEQIFITTPANLTLNFPHQIIQLH